jgi:signal transduction histidine kinase
MFSLTEIIIITFINAFTVFLIIVVLANSSKEKLYRWFAIMTICLTGWVDFAYLGFLEQDSLRAVIFYRLNWAFVAGFFSAAYIFYIECFLKIKKRSIKWTLLIASTVFIYISVFTNLIIHSVITRAWGNEIVFGTLDPLFSMFAVLTTCIFIYYLISRYFTLPLKEKIKVLYFLVGTFSLIIFNLIFNIFLPLFLDTARYQHFGDYSAIVFLAFTAFAVLRHKFLDVKVALAAFLISVIGMLLIVDILLLSDSLPEQGFKVIVFIFFVVISIILVRSVLTEIKQKELLAELSRQQKDIIDVFGHELKTPFTAIKQEATYLLEIFIDSVKNNLLKGKINKQDAEDLLEGLETINIASDQGIQETSTMLETARLDKAHFSLDYSKFDLIEAVKNTYRVIEKQLDSSIFTVNFDFQVTKLEVEADIIRIKEAITALLTNAMKYGINPKTTKSEIESGIRKRDNFAFVSIKDNGVGIKENEIKELGKKFKRLNEKTKGGLHRPGGTGLGLFVVKGIMDKHGGEMIIESKGLGYGSTFTLKFPIHKIKKNGNE